MNRKRSARKRSARKSPRIKSRIKSRRMVSKRTASKRKSRRMVKRFSRMNKVRKSKRNSRRNKRAKFGMEPIHKVNEEHGIITIYGNHSCPACLKVDNICKERKIKYNFIDRDSDDKNQNAIINECKGIPNTDYKYIPVIISANNLFLGGSSDFINLVNGYKPN